MDSLDRFRSEEWSRDGVVTIAVIPSRHFAKRSGEHWVAQTAKVSIAAFAFFAAFASVPFVLPTSDLVQCTAVRDHKPMAQVHSELRQVEPGHWTNLMAFLATFPKDESKRTDFDPEPFT
jgi:hypothetical protein